ncbi:MAG: hypothetical protein ACRDRH_29650 [Pseudonocardia sp.]
MTARTVIEQRLDQARARLVRVDRRAALRTFVGGIEEMRDRWTRLNVAQRRAIVGAVLRTVQVQPAPRRSPMGPDSIRARVE